MAVDFLATTLLLSRRRSCNAQGTGDEVLSAAEASVMTSAMPLGKQYEEKRRRGPPAAKMRNWHVVCIELTGTN